MPRTAAFRRTTRTPKIQPGSDSAPPAPILFRFPNLVDQNSDGEASSGEPDSRSPAETTPEPHKPAAPIATAAIPTQPTASVVPTPPPVAAEQRPVEHAAAQKSESQPAGHRPNRTWWEHWSSGLVLMFLVVALIAASVVAFRDSTIPNDHLLAQDESPEFEIPSLDKIHIPDSAMQGSGQIAAATSHDAADGLNTKSALASADASAIDLMLPTELPSNTPGAAIGPEQVVDGGDLMDMDNIVIPDNLLPSGAVLLSADSQPTPPASIAARPATSQLGMPHVVQSTTTPSDLLLDPPGTTDTLRTPAIQVSTQTNTPEAGASPDLYNGAMSGANAVSNLAGEMPTNTPATNTAAPSNLPQPNPMPALPSITSATSPLPPFARSYASSTDPLIGNGQSTSLPGSSMPGETATQPATSLLATQVPNAGPAPVMPPAGSRTTPSARLASGQNGLPTANPGTYVPPTPATGAQHEPIKTDASELDPDALIRAWQQRSAATPPKPVNSSPNRYRQQ